LRRKKLKKNNLKSIVYYTTDIPYIILLRIACVNKLLEKKYHIAEYYYNEYYIETIISIVKPGKYFITYYIDEINNESKRDWEPEEFYYPKVISRGTLIYDLII